MVDKRLTPTGREKHDRVVFTDVPTEFEILTEPYVIFSIDGYTPVCRVRLTDGTEKLFFIRAISLSRLLEPHVIANGMKWAGLKLRITKKAADRKAPYDKVDRVW